MKLYVKELLKKKPEWTYKTMSELDGGWTYCDKWGYRDEMFWRWYEYTLPKWWKRWKLERRCQIKRPFRNLKIRYSLIKYRVVCWRRKKYGWRWKSFRCLQCGEMQNKQRSFIVKNRKMCACCRIRFMGERIEDLKKQIK